MKPGDKVVDINKEVKERCTETFSGNFGKGYHLSIVSPKDIHYEQKKILDAYEKILSTVEGLSQKNYPKKKFQLVVINFEKKPKNFNYTAPNVKDTETTLVMLEGNEESWTDKIICQLETFAPHEYFHTAVFGLYPGVKEGHFAGAGWFEEGLACYCTYLCDFNFPMCSKKETHSDENKAKEMFLKEEIRNKLWGDFSPGNISWKNRNKFKNMSEEEIKAFWKPIDDGYDASLGAFIYLEKRIGREKLFQIVRNLQGKHDYQDESFYKDLESLLGFDIRKVTTDEIRKVFEK
jgi:hypothetical protein